MLLQVLLVFCFALSSCSAASEKLKVLHEWKYLDFQFDSEEQRNRYIQSGDFQKNASIAIDVDQAPDGRVFVTIVRQKGVPASLVTVTDRMGDGGPLLRPYPDWSWVNGSCKGIVNVYRIFIDRCHHMWVLDTGVFGNDQVCPAQLLLFNLKNDQLIKRVVIPDKYARNANGTGLLVTPVVHYQRQPCRSPAVFMADVEGYGLVIWDSLTKSIWRVESETFRPTPGKEEFVIAGTRFVLADGILGMALNENGTKYLFYKALASEYMYRTPVQKLLHTLRKKETRFPFEQISGSLPSQSAAQAFSRDDVLFFGLTESTSIGCWNKNMEPIGSHTGVIARNNETLQFASGVKVINTCMAEKLWVLTNRFQRFYTGTMNFDETNMRILVGDVHQLIAGTICQRT
ncbi:major royal jelly protein 1 [Orussus abietinus]|uniref:major royal jelly protein 1 n=1 Tax=Orussus abietinus TaxID=222816 RepID=UPI0006263D03|nr:major royal jelly protein 1 [Orussus abietinus]